MKKKIIIIILTTLIVLIASGTILYFQEFSLLQINADNYRTKLKESEEPVYLSGIDNCIPDHFSILRANDFATSNNFENNGIKVERTEINPTRLRITVQSISTNMEYNVWYKENNIPVRAQVICWSNSNLIKQIIDRLIIQEGFILKQSELKSGQDILIKETENTFIIAELAITYEDATSFVIESFSKRKYFQL
jgi:hypothetical protein